MPHIMRLPIVFLVLTVAAASCGGESTDEDADSVRITNGQGEIAGEVTEDSVILQSRLTTTGGFVNGDLPGVAGVGRFEVSTDSEFVEPMLTDWLEAVAPTDFIVKVLVDGLTPDTEYFYRLVYGLTQEMTDTGPTRSFRTLAGAGIAREASFVAVTGMNYHRFYGDPDRQYTGPDRDLGYPALEVMLALRPDFFVATGDNVYYDIPYEGRAETAPTMRRKWHEQLAQPRFIDLFAVVPTYWEKDDHDYRYNDTDNTTDAPPLPGLGRQIFLEQVPVVDPFDLDPVTYRTHRVSRDLQIWLTEGRDYRSSNMMDPGPDKTLWGERQRTWLQRTLLESDATFKILISPTPLIGPDDADQAGRPAENHDPVKRDNHSNQQGFRAERDEFFAWLLENDFLDKNFYIVCGDRHWQYHSRHPNGLEEFSTGAIIDANSRVGRPPGDPNSNDPDALIEQLYTYDEPTGGFLHVAVSHRDPVTAAFSFLDENGTLLYEVLKTASE